jgi:hypothetical protein
VYDAEVVSLLSEAMAMARDNGELERLMLV